MLESEKRGRTRNSKIRSKGRAMAVAVDGDFQPRDVYADFLQPRMRDGDAGALVFQRLQPRPPI